VTWEAVESYAYPMCWGPGSVELKQMRDGVVNAAVAGILAQGMSSALAQALQGARALALQQTLPLFGNSEVQMMAFALNQTGVPLAKAGNDAAALTGAAKQTLLDQIADNSLFANALVANGRAPDFSTAALIMVPKLMLDVDTAVDVRDNRDYMVTVVSKIAVISQGLVLAGTATNITTAQAMVPTLPPGQDQAMLDHVALSGVVAQLTKSTLATAASKSTAEQMAIVNGAVTKPQWGLDGKTWCMGMSETPVTMGEMFDAATLTSHPHQVGPTLGFKKCFDLYLQKDSKAKGVFGGNFLRTDGDGTCAASSTKDEVLYPMPVSRMPMTAVNLNSGQEFVKLIRESRAALHHPDAGLIVDSSTQDIFPTGTPFIFWEQYIDLLDQLKEKLGYALGVSFGTVTLLLFFLSPSSDDESVCMKVIVSIWGSVFVNLFCVITVFEVYGFMGIAGIKLNAIPQVTLIMTMGIAVEFTAHTVLAYICAPAPVGVGVTSYQARQHRTEVALGRMAVPTVHGSITTFLGIVMISISKSKFIVLYYFVLYAFIVLFGFLNGLVVLPALLVVAGPPTTANAQPAPGSDVAGGKNLATKLGDVEKVLDIDAAAMKV